MEDDLVVIRKNLETGRRSIYTHLDQDELYAIGLITVQWGYLEHAILIRTIDLAHRKKMPVPKDAFNMAFKKRRRAYRILIETALKTKPIKEARLRVLSRIANLEQRRHQITHGLWDWDHANPDMLKAHSFRQPHDFEQPFSLDKLLNLAEQIAEVNFDLTYPNGFKKSHYPRLPFVSRSFLRFRPKDSPQDPRHPQATTPKRNDPPRS